MVLCRPAAGSGFGATLLPAPLAALGLARLGGLPVWPAVPLVALVTASVLVAFLASGERRSFGLANGLTLLRLDLSACLLAAAWAGPAGLSWPVFTLAALALVLDGLDGCLARRLGATSAFGARLDMLGDTAFTIVLTLLALRLGGIGPWVLAIGLLRPAFVAAGRLWPPLAAPLPASRRRRAACGLALLLLVLSLAPPIAAAAFGLAATSLFLLLLSFAADIRLLLDRERQ